MTKKATAGAAQNSRLELVSFNYELTEKKLFLYADWKNLDDGRLHKNCRTLFPLLVSKEVAKDYVENYAEDAQVDLKHKEPEEKKYVLYGYAWLITLLQSKGVIWNPIKNEATKK